MPAVDETQAVARHSLTTSLALHLVPGVANFCATLAGFAYVLNPQLPAELVYGVLVNVLVLIPIQLGFLLYLAKKRGNQGLSLRGVVVLDNPLKLSKIVLWSAAILVPTGVIFGVFEPLTTHLDGLIAFDRFIAIPGASAHQDTAFLVLGLNIVLTGIAVPITEELYFRGYLLPRMPLRLGRGGPVVHSLLFAIYHVDTPWMIPVRTVGLLPLIYVTLHTRSTKPGILAHCVVNLADFVVVVSNRWKG